MTDPTAPRILISRMSEIGDAILTLPVACALREHFPNAYLAWVVEKEAAAMVRNHPALNGVIELKPGWFTSPRQIRWARKELRSQDFDVTIDCQGRTKSALACWLSGAPKRIGFAGRYGSPFSRWLNTTLIKPVFRHLTDRSLELLIPLEIHSPRVRWKLPIEETAREWAVRWRKTVSCMSLAVLNPAATSSGRLWTPSHFAACARYLHDRYAYRCVVVWGTPQERSLAEQVVRESGDAAVIAPKTDLHHLAALIETAQLFISVECGPMQLGAAVATPSIGLYGEKVSAANAPYREIVVPMCEKKKHARGRQAPNSSWWTGIAPTELFEAIDKIQRERCFIRAA